MTTPTGSLEPDTLIHDRYRVTQQIGRGGMGAVYEAVDTRLGNTVALKQTLVRGEQLDDAFAREARLLSSLRHAALPVVSDYFAHGDSHFLVMQFIPGTDFGALMAQRSAPFSFGEVLAWADILLDALDYLHTQIPPIVHRDIKPQNLKLTPRGEIVLLDFGLAKGGVTSTGATQAGAASLYGYTPQYAPIEQIQASGTDPRSDLYSLAATLYALLSNQPPANALDRASAALQGRPDPLTPLDQINPQVPAAAARLIASCMALNASERPPSAAAARAELAAAVRTGSAGASTAGMNTVVQHAPTQQASPRPAAPPPFVPGPPPQPPQITRPSPLVPLLIIGVALLLVVVIGGALFVVANAFTARRGPNDTPPQPPGATTIVEINPTIVPTPPALTPMVEFDTTAIALTAVAAQTAAGGDFPNIDATVSAVQTQVAESVGQIPGQQKPSGDSFGTTLLEFGADGTGDGFLSDARSIAVGPDGAIYVADYSTGRVQRFSAEGKFERSWKLEDDRPILAMAADRDGLVYVSQNALVSVFEGATGKPVRTIAKGEGFEDLIVLGDGSLLGIPWASGDIVRLDSKGRDLEKIKDILEEADSHGSPSALAADGLGTIYVLDADAQEVYIFSSEGKFRDKFSAPGAWAFSKLAVDGQGKIYVTGFPGGVSVFSPDGQPFGTISVSGVARDLTFDKENNLYVSTAQPRILKIGIAPPQ
ncbi:protein kinase [Chloroflexales bacterium ZM16-3]|nr:protein kinase [Chloroflexales bacterium ZM16-3]